MAKRVTITDKRRDAIVDAIEFITHTLEFAEDVEIYADTISTLRGMIRKDTEQ